MNTHSLLACFLGCLLLAGCATPRNSTPTLTNFDNGKKFSLVIGELFVVELSGDHTMGYQWHYRPNEQSLVEQVGKPKYLFGPAVDGGGGKEVWTFRAVKAGEQELRMDYSRPWEGKEAIMETVVFRLVVVGDAH